jgi:type IV pilus assembly protein PilM
MKFNFLSKTLPSFGLDVSGGSFKIMQFQKKGSSLAVKSYHSGTMPKGLIINDVISDAKTFDYLLKQALDKPQYGRVDTNYAVVSLPESKSFVRVIQIPKMSESEAESAVPYEAENFIPMPIDQVYLDWQKVGESEDKMNVLMIASPKEFADKYLEILDKAGVRPTALEVESQSCHRALVSPTAKETVLLVDIADLRTSLIMVEDGNLQFTSTIPIAGNTFTDSIAKALGVSSAKAEEIKRKVGIANTTEYPNIKTALLPILNNLTAEIKNILKFHAEHSQKQVSQVFLMGGSAKLVNLAEFLGSQLSEAGVPQVALANPWLNLPQIQNRPIEALESLGFVTAIGLATRGAEYEVL